MKREEDGLSKQSMELAEEEEVRDPKEVKRDQMILQAR